MTPTLQIKSDDNATQHITIQILHANNVNIQLLQNTPTQCANDTSPPTHNTISKKQPTTTHSYTQQTFAYRYATQHTERIAMLYQQLIQCQWIDTQTTPEDFCAIFSGQPSFARIKWTAKQTYLCYMIRRMVNKQLITLPQKNTIWQITESHFIGKNNKNFRNFNKQREPTKAILTINKLVDILDITAETTAE